MKAWIHTVYGPPQVLQLKEVPQPIPKDNEVLIKIHATTVNRTDCGLRSAEYVISRFFTGLLKPKYQIQGNEFAGVIEATGKSVTRFAVGDKVFGYNETTFGAHAQYMAIPESAAIATMPDGFSFEQAAPMLEGSHYALCDIRAAKVESGQNVLVYGATGAIGSAAVQLLKHFGANITAVCNTKNVELVKSLGAHHVIDYTQQDFTKTNQKFNFIFDAVGKSSFGQCKPLLKPKGIYISTELGKNGENIWLALLTPLGGGKKLLFPLPTITTEDVQLIKTLAQTGKFKPVIDRIYKLEEIVEATRYVETGQKTGNVVIKLI